MIKTYGAVLLLAAGAFSQSLDNRQWTSTHGVADRWDFANIFGDGKEHYVTHRNNGQVYATEVYKDGTRRNYQWSTNLGVGYRWAFADLFGTGRKVYVTENALGYNNTAPHLHYVCQYNKDGTYTTYYFSGIGPSSVWAYANVFGNGQDIGITHWGGSNFNTIQMNADKTQKQLTFTGVHGVADRWQFAKVFSPDKHVYVTHRNNGTFYTSELFPNGTSINKTMYGHGVADRWDFANIFGTGRELYVTHRNNGQFYATQLNPDGTADTWEWSGGTGIGNRWAFVDFYGNGREVFVTHKNDGTFYVTQLNEDETVTNRIFYGGHGIADRWDFADVYGNGSKAYVTHRNEGKLYASETVKTEIVLLKRADLSGGNLAYTFTVPENGKDLVVEMSGGVGDADLYMKKGAPPTGTDFDCRPYYAGNNETCSVTGLAAGKYFIQLNQYHPWSGVSLRVKYNP